MKKSIWLAGLITAILSSTLFADQSMRLDLAGGLWVASDDLTFGDTGFLSKSGGYCLRGELQYRSYEHIATPFFAVTRRFDRFPGESDVNEAGTRLAVANTLIDAGICKTFEAGYSKVDVSIGLGYCWRNLEAEGGSLNLLKTDKDGIAFISGFNLHFPFLKRIDASFGYRLAYIEGGDIEGTRGTLDYQFELSDIHHFVVLGLSFIYRPLREPD
jgi:hypothetical protein